MLESHRLIYFIKGVFVLLLVIAVGVLGWNKYLSHERTQQLSDSIISSPQINDIYFLDFRLISKDLRPKEKFRVAKVFDITGDVITLRFGDLLFPTKHGAINSVRFGQLRYSDYFQPERFDYSQQELSALRQQGAIYLAKRPVLGKLFGNFVGPRKSQNRSNHLILGRKEFISAQAHLNDPYSELGKQKAFELFQRSAQLGYPQGQVGLAQMFLNNEVVEQDYQQSLYWLKQASLQSYKPAILKYAIVCKKQPDCYLVDFYQELIDSGVNLKVRELDLKLSPGIN